MIREQFRADLKRLTALEMVHKYIVNSFCYAITVDQHHQLKECISRKFEVPYNDVVIVGSAKLGFSIKPEKRYMEFNDNSDIDVAIVSSELFRRVWEDAYKFRQSRADWPKCDAFFRYLGFGWIRPDMLPPREFEFTRTWWDFFRKITASGQFGPYRIRGGLYYSWFFLEQYQMICIDQCKKEELAVEDLSNKSSA